MESNSFTGLRTRKRIVGGKQQTGGKNAEKINTFYSKHPSLTIHEAYSSCQAARHDARCRRLCHRGRRGRLARRSFIRDVVFFILTVVYLMICTLDGVVTLAESIGFVVIYIVFVAFVAGGRSISMLRADDDHSSFAGSTGHEHRGVSEDLSSLSAYQAAPLQQQQPFNLDSIKEKSRLIIEVAYQEAHAKYFVRDESFSAVEPLPGASGRRASLFNADEATSLRRQSRVGSIFDDFPSKPSKWTSAFYSSQGLDNAA